MRNALFFGGESSLATKMRSLFWCEKLSQLKNAPFFFVREFSRDEFAPLFSVRKAACDKFASIFSFVALLFLNAVLLHEKIAVGEFSKLIFISAESVYT